jgi:hypothetical protein
MGELAERIMRVEMRSATAVTAFCTISRVTGSTLI